MGARARRAGMLAERARLGLPAREDWIIRGDFSLASGHEAASRIIAMDERPTAVFCSADMVAFGLIAGLQAGGLSVPGDISVVGFDDIEMSEYYVPALTTVRQDRRRLGRRIEQHGATPYPTQMLLALQHGQVVTDRAFRNIQFSGEFSHFQARLLAQ